jgi:CheY-like chemotaxis protein
MTNTSQPQPVLVLIVEDYADAREMYAAYLQLSGYRVAEAADGETAMGLAAELRPDVIVMDLALPGVDGWEATRRLKADARTASIPIIALSGHTLPRHLDAARDAGCAVVLVKPLMPDALAAEVARVLASGRQNPRRQVY